MDTDAVARRYRELQEYVGWTADDARRVACLAEPLRPALPGLVEDFYETLTRYPAAARVVTGGAEQIARLRGTLRGWLDELLAGNYDADYAVRRWRVGWRHVEIGLEQVYTNVALARLRRGLHRALDGAGLSADVAVGARRSLDTLLDLDLALIEDAYQAEYARRQQQADRLAAIGQVAGGVAHELRNPLNVVKTSAYFLLNARTPTPEKVAEHLRRIERHANLADGVITALARFARLPVPALAPVRVAGCVAQALEFDAPPARVRTIIELPDGLPDVLADPEQLRIVLGNLFRNAYEAMPDGGELRVSASDRGSVVELAVTDTGVGMPPEIAARVSEPLYTTKARGLGLGLAIVKAILDKSHAALQVESTPGRGSTFTVRLNAAPAGGP